MDSFDNRVEGMKWGFRINEFMTIFALILALSMLIITNRTKPDPLNKEKDRQDLNGTDYEV